MRRSRSRVAAAAFFLLEPFPAPARNIRSPNEVRTTVTAVHTRGCAAAECRTGAAWRSPRLEGPPGRATIATSLFRWAAASHRRARGTKVLPLRGARAARERDP